MTLTDFVLALGLTCLVMWLFRVAAKRHVSPSGNRGAAPWYTPGTGADNAPTEVSSSGVTSDHSSSHFSAHDMHSGHVSDFGSGGHSGFDPGGHGGDGGGGHSGHQPTHSFAFALFVAIVIGLLAPIFRLGAWRTGLVSWVVATSHAVLDTFTNGGLGCALLWPFDHHRYFAPWTPIPVAPIGRRFFSHAGLVVALTELAIFAPLFLYAVWPRRRAVRE